MFANTSFNTITEYLRRVEIVNVTETGVYMEDEVPEDYTGSVLVMEITHEIVYVDSTGQLLQQVLNPPVSLDKDGEKADGLIIDGVTVKEGNKPVNVVTKFNDDLPEDLVARITAMLKLYEMDGEF